MRSLVASKVEAPAGSSALLPVVFAAAMLLCVLACAAFAFLDTGRHPEFAQAGDPFGYLQMAEDLRVGHGPNDAPRFTVDSEHLRQYLAFLKEHGRPMEGEYGPGVYHFSAGTGKIISPYPPGVPVMLAAFGRGRAVFSWQVITMGAFVLLAAGACAWMAKKRSWEAALGAALVALLAQFALLTLGLAISYSVDLSWLPLLVAVAAAFLGRRLRGWKGGTLLALAGAALGWAVLVRLSNGAFLPGFLLLMMGGGWKRSATRAALFVAGFAAAGIAPLMIYDAAMTGSALHSTYLAKDAAGLSAAVLATNARYYFAGPGSGMLWVFVAGVAGFVLWAIGGASKSGGRNPLRASGGAGAILAIAAWWALPTAYFLVHRIYTPYYQFPTMLVSLAGMACCVLDSAKKAAAPKNNAVEPARRKIRLALALAPVAGMALYLAAYLPPLSDPALMALPDLSLPPALENPRAWIIADRLGGALCYYHGIVAPSIVGLDPPTRRALFQYLHGRGEPVYLIVDDPAMAAVAREMAADGLTLVEAGNFAARTEPDGSKSPYTKICRVQW